MKWAFNIMHLFGVLCMGIFLTAMVEYGFNSTTVIGEILGLAVAITAKIAQKKAEEKANENCHL